MNDILTNDAFQQLIYVIVVAILGWIGKYGVDLLKAYTNAKIDKVQDDKVQSAIYQATDTVYDIVRAINQTTVDSLKKSGTFDKKAQEEVKNKAIATAEFMISNEFKKILNYVYGSFDSWLDVKIEEAVKENK